MTDIVERLRALDGTFAITTILDRCTEAADEIERLRLSAEAGELAGYLRGCEAATSAADGEIEQLRAGLCMSPAVARAARRIIAWRGPGHGYGTTDDALALASDAIAVAHALLSHKAEDDRFGQPNFGHGNA